MGVAAVHLSEVMKTRPTGTEAGGILFVWENYVPISSYIPDAGEGIHNPPFSSNKSLESLQQIGFVRVFLALEDRGGVEVPTAQDHMYDHTKQEGFAAALELDLWLRAEQVSSFMHSGKC